MRNTFAVSRRKKNKYRIRPSGFLLRQNSQRHEHKIYRLPHSENNIADSRTCTSQSIYTYILHYRLIGPLRGLLVIHSRLLVWNLFAGYAHQWPTFDDNAGGKCIFPGNDFIVGQSSWPTCLTFSLTWRRPWWCQSWAGNLFWRCHLNIDSLLLFFLSSSKTSRVVLEAKSGKRQRECSSTAAAARVLHLHFIYLFIFFLSPPFPIKSVKVSSSPHRVRDEAERIVEL